MEDFGYLLREHIVLERTFIKSFIDFNLVGGKLILHLRVYVPIIFLLRVLFLSSYARVSGNGLVRLLDLAG